MRQHLSVLMVAVRSTMYKTAGIILLMAAAETAVFLMQLQKKMADGQLVPLGEFIDTSGIPLISGVAFLLLCGILSLVGYEISGSRMRYTIRRFSVREETTTLLWAGHNMIALFIFWAAQLGIVLLLSYLYIDFMEPVYSNRQTLFLAFHRSGFLHSLLPLEEVSRLLRNFSLIISIGIAAACFSLRQRRGQRGIAVAVLAALTFLSFIGDIGQLGWDLNMTLLMLIVAAYLLYWIFRGENNEA